MDNELQQLLCSILKEELTPINERLGVIEQDTAGMKEDIGQLKQDTAVMKKGIFRLKQDTQQLKVDMVEIKFGQEKLQKNIIENLGEYTGKMIEHNDNKAEVLNKRVFKLEVEMEQVTKQ